MPHTLTFCDIEEIGFIAERILTIAKVMGQFSTERLCPGDPARLEGGMIDCLAEDAQVIIDTIKRFERLYEIEKEEAGQATEQ